MPNGLRSLAVAVTGVVTKQCHTLATKWEVGVMQFRTPERRRDFPRKLENVIALAQCAVCPGNRLRIHAQDATKC